MELFYKLLRLNAIRNTLMPGATCSCHWAIAQSVMQTILYHKQTIYYCETFFIFAHFIHFLLSPLTILFHCPKSNISTLGKLRCSYKWNCRMHAADCSSSHITSHQVPRHSLIHKTLSLSLTVKLIIQYGFGRANHFIV
jgi:hypothetical protein